MSKLPKPQQRKPKRGHLSAGYTPDMIPTKSPTSSPASSPRVTNSLLRSYSVADIGSETKEDDPKRSIQMQQILRQFAQPKSHEKGLTGRDQRRKQVDAIYAYLESHGMQPVPASIQVCLEDYVNENKKYFAWLPTEPKYLVICEPTPESNAEASTTNVPTSGAPSPRGKPQGFLAALGELVSEDKSAQFDSPRRSARLFNLEFSLLSSSSSKQSSSSTPRLSTSSAPSTPRATTPRGNASSTIVPRQKESTTS